MTSREIFDKVKKALLEQNEQSVEIGDYSTNCRYRSQNGLKCAIGHLIPDELYNSSYENYIVAMLPENVLEYILPTNLSRNIGIVFLDKLQLIHDCNDVRNWQKKFDEFESTHVEFFV